MPKKVKPQKPLANGRSKGDDRHVRVHLWELNSPAYRSLAVHARAALVEIRARYNGGNNGDIVLSVRQLADLLNCHRDTASKAFHELEERGFIRAKSKGSFSQKQRLATTWILTNVEYNGNLATKDFMRWEAGKN